MQKAFDAAPYTRRANLRLDENGRALLAAWRERGWPIIHVRHDSIDPQSPLRAGLPGHAMRPGFESVGGEALVAKSVNAAFIGTDLDLRLRRLGARSVVVFGLTTDMCVSTTARVGANLGYVITVVGDACDCFGQAAPNGRWFDADTMQAAHLATLAAEFARVVDTADLLSMSLLRLADGESGGDGCPR
jgi:nicotinamidase-related amidase